MSLLLFWRDLEEISERTIIVTPANISEKPIYLYHVGSEYDSCSLYVKAYKYTPIIYPSFNKDEPTEKYSIGGNLQITNLIPDKIFTDIEYHEMISGTLDFHKLFIHNPNAYNNIVFYFKKHPRKYNIFIPIYENYLERSFYNDISDLFSSTNLRLFTHFNLYENITNIPTNIIRLEKIHHNLYKDDDLVPNLWKNIFPNYIPEYLKIGDQIIIHQKGLENVYKLGIYEIVDIEEYVNYFEITLDQPVSHKLYKNEIYISHYFDYRYYLGDSEIPNLNIKNFQVHSLTGNYRIDNYPIELDYKGTLTERVKIEFTERNVCKVIFQNNQISYGNYDITSQDIEVFNNFIDGDPLWFRIKKEGFTGYFNTGDSIEFEIYGQDFPIWFLRYIPKNTLEKLPEYKQTLNLSIS